MIRRALDADLPCGWVTAEAACVDARLRHDLKVRGPDSVLPAPASRGLFLRRGVGWIRAGEYAAEAEAAPGGLAWEKPPCGEGADGGTPCRWAAL
ncbi:hypothetical protein ACG2DA_23140, partial [Alienimonas sp. DA493]